MKKLLAIALVLTLLLSLGVSAFAEEAQFNNTAAFLEAMEGYEGFELSLIGVTRFAGKNYEQVNVHYEGELSKYSSTFSVLFNEDEADIVMYMPNVIHFEESRLEEVLAMVNALNAQSAGLKAYVDTSDNSVSVELFQIVTEDSLVDITQYGLGFLIGASDRVYENLADYAV